MFAPDESNDLRISTFPLAAENMRAGALLFPCSVLWWVALGIIPRIRHTNQSSYCSDYAQMFAVTRYASLRLVRYQPTEETVNDAGTAIAIATLSHPSTK